MSRTFESKVAHMVAVKLEPEEVTLRPWSAVDAEALVRLGDDREIWLNLRDRFPRPFTIPATDLWLAEHIAEEERRKSFAIEWHSELVGGIHLRRRNDAHQICSDLAFWVGRPFWGRGIATAAVRSASAHAFDTLGLERVQAFVFDWNPASARVLENANFTFEGRLRHYVLKDGRYGDALLYARLRSEHTDGLTPPVFHPGSADEHLITATAAARAHVRRS
jgi:ribosomal-protein-alanine N-acetyltransferase